VKSRLRIADVEVETRHWIGGEPSAGGTLTTFEDVSPIDGRVLGELSAGGAVEIDAAVAAARSASRPWASLGPQRRGEILDRFAQGILDRKEALAAVETTDNGSLLLGNQKRVVERAAHNIGFFSQFARQLSADAVRGPIADNDVRYEPAGVAALVVPWNAPLLLATWKMGPALAAGNTVVLKPSEWAPLSCSLLTEIALGAGVPRGVINVVHGFGAEAGRALVEHPGVDRIAFTGSVATGRTVARAAAANLTPVSLELGGKSPFIVFEDANLDDAAATIVAQFHNAGQVCLAGTRVLVQEAIERELRRRVLAAAEKIVVGDPRRPEVRVGPLIHPEQLDRVKGFVDRACRWGAVALLGGYPHSLGGLYYSPTILSGMKHDAEIVKSEVFGPVLTWQTFRAEEQAVDMANSTDYGLAAILYTGDPERAQRVAARVVAGTVWVNCFFVRDLAAPFGGARKSGIGREGGRWSFDFFCDVKNVASKRDSFKAAALPSCEPPQKAKHG
jgi:aminomuconate-semialdehyde/2-hydroxymuconate-6-semialdehyde dehydrogenase